MKQKSNVSSAGYMLALAMLFVATFIIAQAQTFSNPPSPAPDNPSLNDFASSGGSSDYVSLNSTLAQTIDGSLSIATSTQSGAVIGDYINNISIVGFTGVTGLPAAPPALSSYSISDLTGAAVYGYATGNPASEKAIGAVGSVASSEVCVEPEIVIVDPGGGSVADIYSLAMALSPTDGFPVLAYIVETTDTVTHLMVTKCKDNTCDPNVPGYTSTEIASGSPASSNAIDFVSIAAGGVDDVPFVAYLTGNGSTYDDVWLIRCNDEACTSPPDSPVLVQNASPVEDTQVVIRADDIPIVMYQKWSGSGMGIRAASCTTTACTAFESSVLIAPDNVISFPAETDAILGSNNLPILTYQSNDNFLRDLMFAECAVPDCSSLTAGTPIIVSATGNRSGEYPDMRIGSDGNPAIFHFEFISAGPNNKVLFSHCNDAICVSPAPDPPTAIATGLANLGSPVAMAISPVDGFPALVYFDGVDTALFVKCNSLDCTDADPAIVIDDTLTQLPHMEMIIGSDNNPIFIYVREVGGVNDIRSFACFNETCTEECTASGPSGVPVIGETIDAAGYAGKFFGPVRVSDTGSLSGDITVQDKVITSQLIANSIVQTTPALQSSDEIRIEGAYTQGVFSYDNTDAANIGIFSSSATTYSFYAENLYDSGLTLFGDDVSGIRGESTAQTDGVGVQGYATLGNGVYGIVDGVSNLPAVEGVAIGAPPAAGEYNAGVYGMGGAFAAYFEGDVNITGGSLFIGDTGISAANLAAMLTWCDTDCP